MISPLSERGVNQGRSESAEIPHSGVRLTFVEPDVLQGYILSPERLTTASLAERMSGIRERVLGEFSWLFLIKRLSEITTTKK